VDQITGTAVVAGSQEVVAVGEVVAGETGTESYTNFLKICDNT
jgi:hypothetical protein